MKNIKEKGARRLRRHRRIRRKVRGSETKPRLCVFRSLRHIYCQLVDDETGRTLAAASTLEKDLDREGIEETGKKQDAAAVGRAMARKAREAGVETVVFDRGGFRYHGRVKVLADAAREAGLRF